MKKFLIVRHGESIGNVKRIIQGNKFDEGLTELGNRQVENLLKSNKEKLQELDTIISSPNKRTLETANIIKNGIKKNIEVDFLCQEFNAGILAGNTHEENKIKYPEYYKIWKNRGDLDGIPQAETGERLQARVISFLAQYIDRENFNELIVTHAGFMRCLINTINGEKRTNPIIVDNSYMYEIENPLENISIVKKERAMTSQVYIINTREQKYVVKIKSRTLNKEDFLEEKLLNNLSKEMENLPIILNLANDRKLDKSIKVIKYLEGTPIYGKLNVRQENLLINKTKELQCKLENINQEDYQKMDLEKTILEKSTISRNPYIKQMEKEILNDYKNLIKMRYSEYGFVHDDLNRDNILFTDNDVSIIDFESIKILPKDYQLAVLLVSSFLIEGDDIEHVMSIAKAFDKDLDEEYIQYLMKIRLYMGMHFFAEKQYIGIADKEIAKAILKKYFLANEKLLQYQNSKKKLYNYQYDRGCR